MIPFVFCFPRRIVFPAIDKPAARGYNETTKGERSGQVIDTIYVVIDKNEVRQQIQNK